MRTGSRIVEQTRGEGCWRYLRPFTWMILLVLGCAATVAWPRSPELRPSRQLIVKFKSEGEHALRECAETLFRHGRPFAPATSDASASIDRLHRRVGTRRVRALFRRPDGRPLAEQRDRMRRRVGHRLHAGRSQGGAKRELGPPPDLSHVYLVELGEEVPLREALSLYASDEHVAYVQRDHTHRLDELPNDPFLTSSGAWGQAFEDLWGLHRIRAPEAWAVSRGKGVVVAVVDTGLDYDHPDIAQNVWLNAGEDLNGNGRVDDSDWNGRDDDGNGFIDDLRGFDFANSLDVDQDGYYDAPGDVSDPDPFDDRGHGTHVAGSIAAIGDNGIGIIGVAPEAKIMPLKGFPDEGEGLDSVLWRAVLYAAENGAQVVNTSWSCSPFCPVNPLAEEVVELVHAMDVVIVTSAGNRSSDVVFNSPENMREVITVASSGQDDQPSKTFTNMGWIVDVAAPGGGPAHGQNVPTPRRNILSLRSSADEDSEPFSVAGDYLRLAGTSMSAPHVSGVVALLRSIRPDLDYEAIRRLVRQSAVDLGPPGHDRRMGAGRLDAFAAVTAGPLPDLLAAITSPRQGSVFQPSVAVIEVRGSAAGDDLQEFSLSYGLGTEPESWVPITSRSSVAVRDGVLGRWEVSERDQGAYVLKLEVRADDGTVYSEFLELSLEQGRFTQISSSGAHAYAPDIAGRLVVWQSRRGPTAENRAVDDLNLFVSDLASGEEHAIQTGPGNQVWASISAAGRESVISWLDDRSGPERPEVFACRFDSGVGSCSEFAAAPGVEVGFPPVSARGRVFWVDQSSGRGDVRGCLPDPLGRRCEQYDLGLDPGTRGLLNSDGESLVWTEFEGWQQFLARCEIDEATGECRATRLDSPIYSLSRAAASGRFVAWVGFRVSGEHPLEICQLEPETGACPSVRVAEGVPDTRPRLSGNRLVWDASVGDQAGDVFLCEFDPVRRRCPVQRLTAHMAPQGDSAIDGNRVVWVDARAGANQIFGLELPRLAPMRDRRIREGGFLRIPVRARHRRAGTRALRLEAEAVGDVSLEALGARFVDRGRGHGSLDWRPGFDQAGDYAITFSATTSGGVVTRHTLRIEVVDVNRPPVVRITHPRLAVLGGEAMLDACGSYDPDGESLSFLWTRSWNSAWSDGEGKDGERVLGTDCSVRVPSPHRPGVTHYRVAVGDGVHERFANARILWLPRRLAWLWRYLRP